MPLWKGPFFVEHVPWVLGRAWSSICITNCSRSERLHHFNDRWKSNTKLTYSGAKEEVIDKYPGCYGHLCSCFEGMAESRGRLLDLSLLEWVGFPPILTLQEWAEQATNLGWPVPIDWDSSTVSTWSPCRWQEMRIGPYFLHISQRSLVFLKEDRGCQMSFLVWVT